MPSWVLALTIPMPVLPLLLGPITSSRDLKIVRNGLQLKRSLPLRWNLAENLWTGTVSLVAILLVVMVMADSSPSQDSITYYMNTNIQSHSPLTMGQLTRQRSKRFDPFRWDGQATQGPLLDVKVAGLSMMARLCGMVEGWCTWKVGQWIE